MTDMSVIVAVISDKDGVVASDGIRFAPTQIGQPAPVESLTFDKTFALAEGKIIGAFCGLVEFSGRTIAEHVSDVVGATVAHGATLEPVFDQVATEMRHRLNQVSEGDVALAARVVDLLMVGGQHLTRSDMRIFSARFHPRGGDVILDKNSHSKFCRAGADGAAATAGAYLDQNYDGNRGATYLGSTRQEGYRGCGFSRWGAGASPRCPPVVGVPSLRGCFIADPQVLVFGTVLRLRRHHGPKSHSGRSRF